MRSTLTGAARWRPLLSLPSISLLSFAALCSQHYLLPPPPPEYHLLLLLLLHLHLSITTLAATPLIIACSSQCRPLLSSLRRRVQNPTTPSAGAAAWTAADCVPISPTVDSNAATVERSVGCNFTASPTNPRSLCTHARLATPALDHHHTAAAALLTSRP